MNLYRTSVFILLGLMTYSAQGALVVSIGSATVDVSAGTGTANASIDVFLSNEGTSAESAFGYLLFYDILEVGGLGQGLPTGVSFSSEPATSGGLFPARVGGLIVQDSTQARGVLSIAETQFVTQDFPVDSNQRLHTINFEIDRSTAVAGEYQIVLDQSEASDGFTLGSGTAEDPAFRPGILSITAVPEPSTYGVLSLLGAGWVMVRRRRRRV